MANDNGITIGQLTEQLNQKMDLPTGISQDTMDYVVEWKTPTADDPTWFRKYKSGWVEQGGKNNTSVISTNSIVINLLKRMRDTNFGVNITKYDTNSAANLYYGARVKSVSTEQITVVPDSPSFYWEVKGQGA